LKPPSLEEHVGIGTNELGVCLQVSLVPVLVTVYAFEAMSEIRPDYLCAHYLCDPQDNGAVFFMLKYYATIFNPVVSIVFPVLWFPPERWVVLTIIVIHFVDILLAAR